MYGDCSCTTYANSDIRGEGSDCTIWYGDLLDIRLIPEAGQDRYIRLAVSETGMNFKFWRCLGEKNMKVNYIS